MALTGKEFVKKVEETIEPLFKASELQTEAYSFKPDLDECISTSNVECLMSV